jgi:hypothetical protein
MDTQRTAQVARRWCRVSGLAVAALCAFYAIVLVIRLLSLPSPAHPIQPPWLPMMELLILAISPAMVAWAVAVHMLVPAPERAWALAGVVFMAMSATVTCAVHWSILNLGSEPAFAGEPWARWVFAFQWPSVVYALDILAWDVFFPLAAACAAMALRPVAPRAVLGLLWAGAALAFAGLAGVPLADMQARNLGIVGYVGLFPAATAWLALWLPRAGSGPGAARLGKAGAADHHPAPQPHRQPATSNQQPATSGQRPAPTVTLKPTPPPPRRFDVVASRAGVGTVLRPA